MKKSGIDRNTRLGRNALSCFSDCEVRAFRLLLGQVVEGSLGPSAKLPVPTPPSRLFSTRRPLMLTIWGDKQRFCDGITRRNFLQIGAFGAGLTLADMLRAPGRAEPPRPSRPRNKAAIMIYLPGGPSHMDMYDLKPDAPKEFRGEFNPIETNVPGVQICEHIPLQARMWDKLACIRSIVSVDEHSDSPRHDRLQRERQPHRPPSVVRLGDVEAARRRQQRRAAVRQPARHEPRAPSPATSASPTGRSPRAAPASQNLRLRQRRQHRPHGRPQGPARPASTPSAATSTPAAP